MRSHRDSAFITSELAEIFGMTTEGMRVRLETLQEEERIYKKKSTEKGVVW
jgi:predicted ArsR family transcriptional regulator